MIILLILSSFIIDHSVACTDDIGICSDGTYISRDGNNNCEFKPCPDGSCITKGKCVNPNTNQCELQVQCFANPCEVNDPGCILPQVCVSNYCGSCHAVCQVPSCANSNPCPKDTFCDDTPNGPICRNIGDKCGSPPEDCPALKCLCGLCPNGQTQYGCCSICVVEDFGNVPYPICSGVINQERVCKCGGYGELCVEYFDGCNTCICNHGSESCTEMVCKVMEKPKCTKCIFGYVPDFDGECREIKKCNTYSDCDIMNGFECRIDPIQWENIFKCAQWGNCGDISETYVCVDISGTCVTDSDCVNGYTCVGMTHRGYGFCSKYE